MILFMIQEYETNAGRELPSGDIIIVMQIFSGSFLVRRRSTL